MYDPLLRSGLALAGANETIALWRKGVVPSTLSDGILTASEAAGLDLDGTQIVTLSGCVTALGDGSTAQGVLGLRRGFAIAGAENLMLTLWNIPDRSSSEVMNIFYENIIDGINPCIALSQSQKEILSFWDPTNKRDVDKHLWQAIRRTCPFVMVNFIP